MVRVADVSVEVIDASVFKIAVALDCGIVAVAKFDARQATVESLFTLFEESGEVVTCELLVRGGNGDLLAITDVVGNLHILQKETQQTSFESLHVESCSQSEPVVAVEWLSFKDLKLAAITGQGDLLVFAVQIDHDGLEKDQVTFHRLVEISTFKELQGFRFSQIN